MNQNTQKEKGPSLSANSNNYLIGTFRFPNRTPRDKEKSLPFNTKLPPISSTVLSNQHHPIIFSKPKFPHASLHVNQSLSTKAGPPPNLSRLDMEEDESNISIFRKNKNTPVATTSSNNATLKNIQFSTGSLHMPSANIKNQESDIKEIKKTLGIESSNDMSNYNKIVKDLESIIEQTHFPSSLKNNKSNFFDVNLTKTQTESKSKAYTPKKIVINKTPNKLLSPLKLKSPMNFDANIATSLLFSPNQLLNPEYLPTMEPSKSSSKKNGIVKAYAANTHQGLVRNYNEDRVAIILNIMKPPNKKDVVWPLCSFFAIYDGHGGTKCAEFLRDNLHHYVVKDQNFPGNPKMAIKKGFQLAEKTFLDYAQSKSGGILDKSGSCAIVVLIVDDMCYVANVGDSRAVLSQEKGNKIIPLSKDHKPEQEEEKVRIIEAGGQIYQSQSQTMQIQGNAPKTIFGPFRVLPGRLSVSRTFGDGEAKIKAYGGNPNVIIAEPDIKSFKISEEHDFIMLGCDGIFDRLTNKEAMKGLWETTSLHKYKNVHEFSARAIENLMKEALMHKTLDNITSVMIGFKNLKNALFAKNKNDGKENFQSNVDKNGNDKLDLIEYKYSPDNPNEAADEPLNEKSEKNNDFDKKGKNGQKYK